MASAGKTVTTLETIHSPAVPYKDEIYTEMPAEIMQELESSDADLLKCHPKLLLLSKTRDFTNMVMRINKCSQSFKRTRIYSQRRTKMLF